MARKIIMAQKPVNPISERHRPRKQEGDFEVEQDEEDGDQVVAHIELHARVFEGFEAAFVGEFFFPAGPRMGDDADGPTRMGPLQA
jgi:hypothetical protein